LRGEHGQFRDATRRIVHCLEQVSPTNRAAFSSICDELSRLLEKVEEHSRREIAILQEAMVQDSGGGEG
jgi:hypothetical protein